MFQMHLLALTLMLNAPASLPISAVAPLADVAERSSSMTCSAMTVAMGEMAPDFDFLSSDYFRRHLHDVLEDGSVLLVFAATDAQLRDLEADHVRLTQAGVVPLVVLAQSGRDARATVERCQLKYALLSDPKGHVAEQYGMWSASTGERVTGWYVIDRAGRVRGAGSFGSESPDWATIASAVLNSQDERMADSN